jgi:hypothetical protein
MLRDQVTLVESIVTAVSAADFGSWKTWVFLYLLACLTIQSSPFAGNLRGSLGAIALLGVGTALATSLLDVADPRVRSVWDVLNLAVAALFFLLLASLLIRGAVGLIRLLHAGA